MRGRPRPRPRHRLPSSVSPPSLLVFLLRPSALGALSSSSARPPPPPPFRLGRIDHAVLRCRDYASMYAFYTEVLGCTTDGPGDVGRFGGALTHLRAGDAMIDLLSYDGGALTEEGREAVVRMHGGGAGPEGGEGGGSRSVADLARFAPGTSTLDHLCLRVDPFDEGRMRSFFEGMGVEIVGSGQRYGSEGVGPSMYVRDPEGNVVELKGPSRA